MDKKQTRPVMFWMSSFAEKRRRLLFYAKMKTDCNKYAARRTFAKLPFPLFESSCPIEEEAARTGIPFNRDQLNRLQAAASGINGLIIAPGETFSFWMSIKNAKNSVWRRKSPAESKRDAGSELSIISSMICWLILHSPMTITERHGQEIRMFPVRNRIMGTEAVVCEGQLDFKAANHTYDKLQLFIAIEGEMIRGAIYSEYNPHKTWEVVNGTPLYYKEQGHVYETVDVYQEIIDRCDVLVAEKLAYRNNCRIGYTLPEDTDYFKKE